MHVVLTNNLWLGQIRAEKRSKFEACPQGDWVEAVRDANGQAAVHGFLVQQHLGVLA